MVKEMLELRILDNFGMKIFTTRVLISDKKALAQALSFLSKYGIDLEELALLVREDRNNYYDYSNI